MSNLVTLRKYKNSPNFYTSSSSRKVYSESLEMFLSKPMVAGNSKLDKSMLVFDLLAIDTCLNCKDCAKDCYAMKAQRQYPACFNKRSMNTWLARNNRDELSSMIREQLDTTKRKIVRIHSSGDFFDNAYVAMWLSIACDYPHIEFYGYSKSFGILETLESLNSLPNVNIVRSVLPNGKINFGDLEHITKLQKEYKGFVCPYGMEDKEPVQCGTDCKACLNNEFVYFLKH